MRFRRKMNIYISEFNYKSNALFLFQTLKTDDLTWSLVNAWVYLFVKEVLGTIYFCIDASGQQTKTNPLHLFAQRWTFLYNAGADIFSHTFRHDGTGRLISS